MHAERVEAIVERTLERYLGDVQMLENLEAVLRKTNTNMAGPDMAVTAQNAKLMQQMFLGFTNLARVVGNLAEAAQRLQERIATLEGTIAPLQEAVINAQVRLRQIEEGGTGAASAQSREPG